MLYNLEEYICSIHCEIQTTKRGETMKKFWKTLTAMVLVCSMLVIPVYANPDMDELEDQKNQAEAEMESLMDQLESIMTEITETDEKLILKGEEIIQAQEDLEEAEIQEQEQYEAMKLRIVAMYENGNSSMIEKILESGSIADMLKCAENIQSMQKYDRDQLQKYVETKEKIETLKSTLEVEMEALEELQANLKEKKSELETLKNEKAAEIADFDAQIQEAARKAAEEAARREEERRKEEEEANNQQNSSNNSSNNSSSSSGNNSGSSNSGTTSSPSYNNGGTGDRSVAQAIVSAAWSYVGVPYVYGGTSRNGIDCSGLTMRCHQAAGISIPRTSGAQAGQGRSISSLSEALPGDVICYPGHVAIYLGNSRVIHAPQPGDVVKEASVYMGSSQPITAIRRYW